MNQTSQITVMKNVDKILQEVRTENIKQLSKWGVQNHPCLDQVLLGREGGCTPERMCQEYDIPTEGRAQSNCNRADERDELTWAHILVEEVSEVVSSFDPKKRRKELIQVAAVAIAQIDKIDRMGE